MKKMYGLFFAMLFLTVTINAVSITGDVPVIGNEAEYYTPGIINPAEGTIELNALPTRPGSEFQNGWYFAFGLTPGQVIKGNNLLAIYTPSREHGFIGLSGVTRIGDKTYSVVNANQGCLKTGVPVNIALSWGKGGLLLYVDGKLYAKGPFPKNGELSPMSALFRVGVDSPFNVQAVKISTSQLSSEKLTANPAKGFVKSSDTSFMLRKGKRAEYFSTDYAGKNFSALMPVWRLAGAMSAAGEKSEITAVGLNLTSGKVTYKVKIDAKTFEGADAGSISRDITLPATPAFAELQLPLPVKNTGFYNLNIAITGPDGRTVSWLSNYMIFPANDKSVKDGKFDNYVAHHMLEVPEVLNKLDIHWSRAWDHGGYFLWHNVEPQKGVFDWAAADKAVANATQNGVNILGVLGYPPLWAAEDPQYKKIPHPLAYMSGRWKPRSVQEWEDYVTQVVSRYKGQVKYWEVYNEVDFHPPGMPASFSGSTKDYFELLKATWKAAKKADPECKILISGFSTVAVCDLNMPFDLLKMGAAKYIDIFSIHSYQGVMGVDKLRQAIDAVAPEMPFWQTEQMWHEVSGLRKQAELTAAIHFWFIDKKFDKYFNFGTAFFSDRYSNSPEVMLQALAVVQNNLRKCDVYIGTLPDAKISDFDIRHSFKRTDGSYFTAIGKVGTPVELRLAGDIIRAEDLQGRELSITRNGGVFVIQPSAIVFIVSKTPLKIIDAKYEAKKLVENPGFEDVSGDSMGGLKSLVVSGWKFNVKGGEIMVDKDARSGKYALKISADAKGNSATIDFRDFAPGKYVLSAWLKSGKNKPATANFAMLEFNTRRYVSKKFSDISSEKYTKYTAEFELKVKPESGVKFYIGAEPDNSILCDDVDLVKLPTAGAK